jgi:hypothetical protein
MMKSWRMRWTRHVALMGRRGIHKGKRQIGRPRHRRVDNIKIDLREIGWGDMKWIDLVQDRDQWRVFVNTVMNFRVP